MREDSLIWKLLISDMDTALVPGPTTSPADASPKRPMALAGLVKAAGLIHWPIDCPALGLTPGTVSARPPLELNALKPQPQGSVSVLTVMKGPLWNNSTPASSHPPSTRSTNPLTPFRNIFPL